MPRKLLVIRRKGKLRMKSRSVLQLQFSTKSGGQVVKEFPIRDLDAILVIGADVYIESSILTVLPTMNVPVSTVARDAVGMVINPTVIITPTYRQIQYQLKRARGLSIALEYIKAKIKGMQNILKYHRAKVPDLPLPPAEAIDDAARYEFEIRIWESTASHTLWSKLTELIKPDYLVELKRKYGFSGRKPTHPDPFNKTLSLMYAVLYSLATKALTAAGLDPTYGFLHRTRYSTPLTFDYTEMFKPLAIEATITLINKKGLPRIDEDGELPTSQINNAIRVLYEYLTAKHKHTGKTLYQYIFLKAYCLAKHLEGKCPKTRLTITWNKAEYKLSTI